MIRFLRCTGLVAEMEQSCGSGAIIDRTDVLLFQGPVVMSTNRTQRNSSISLFHLLRDKLISYWDVLHYCSPVEAHFKAFLP